METLIAPRETLVKIENYLERLLSRSRALCVLLVDISGQLIAEKGNNEGLDTSTLAALAASNVAATAEIARQLDEPEPFSYLFHEGKRRHIYISAIGASSLLVIIFDEMTQIGLVRIFARLAVNELLEVASELESWLQKASGVVDREFRGALAEGLDEAFS